MQIRSSLYLILVFIASCGAPADSSAPDPSITITNRLDHSRKDALVHLDALQLAQSHKIKDWAKVKFMAGEEVVPFEGADLDADGTVDQVSLLLQMEAGERKNISLIELAPGEIPPTFPKRTQAEISHKTGGYWQEREYQGGTFKNVEVLHVPPEHTDHSWYIRYEGPGWESDLVGYRFYLDWRNATDIFGKKTTEMVLDQVGQDGFDAYHEPAAWGQDILKVGKSLGVGSIGTWREDHALRVEETDSLVCTIVQNGNLESMIRTQYHGWKVGEVTTDLTAELSIHAGSRLTKTMLTLSNPLDNLCTGIGKLENAALITGEKGNWGYLATWGQQSLAGDNLGMAVLYRKKDLVEQTEDDLSYVVVLQPENKELAYYFLAAWEQEPGGIKNKSAFLAYLENVLLELDAPLSVEL